MHDWEDLSTNEMELVRAGWWIVAAKAYRNRTGFTLKSGKELAREYREEYLLCKLESRGL